MNVQKGTKVYLLEPLWDGTQYFQANEDIFWPFDVPPSSRQASMVAPDLQPKAPPMGDGTPPEGYIDPRTGEPLAKPDYSY